MNKKVYLCDIEALKEGTNDKYGVSATLVFNEGLTYKELEQVIDEKYFYLSNNNLQEEIEDLKADYGSKAQVERDILQNRIDEAIEYIENNDLYTQDIDYDYDDNMYLSPPDDETERKDLLEILRGEDNEL